MADNVSLTPGGAVGAVASSEEVTTLNAAAVLAQHLQRIIVALRTADGVAVDVSAANPVPVGGTLALDAPTLAALETIQVGNTPADPATQTTLAAVLTAVDGVEGLLTSIRDNADTLEAVLAHGTYGYAAGVAPATVDVPAGARVRSVSVAASEAGAATVTIAGGATVTIPAGGAFDTEIRADAAAGGDVVVGGSVASYYVAWQA